MSASPADPITSVSVVVDDGSSNVPIPAEVSEPTFSPPDEPSQATDVPLLQQQLMDDGIAIDEAAADAVSPADEEAVVQAIRDLLLK